MNFVADAVLGVCALGVALAAAQPQPAWLVWLVIGEFEGMGSYVPIL